jgi:hypothetical protein
MPSYSTSLRPEATTDPLDTTHSREDDFSNSFAVSEMGADGSDSSTPTLDASGFVSSPDGPAGSGSILGDLLNVVDSPEQAAAPNDITQEEFDELVTLMDDIRSGQSNLVIDDDVGTPELQAFFETELLTDVGRIMQTSCGRELLNQLVNVDSDQVTTVSLNNLTAMDELRFEKPHEVSRGGSALDVQGEGRTIDYAPGVDSYVGQPGHDDLAMGSDTILFHELVHASGQATGDRAEGTVGGMATTSDDAGVNLEEYRATGLGDYEGASISENAYRAERKALDEAGEGRPLDAEAHKREVYSVGAPDQEAESDLTEYQYNVLISGRYGDFYNEYRNNPAAWEETKRFGEEMHGPDWVAGLEGYLGGLSSPSTSAPPRAETTETPEAAPTSKTVEEWATWSEQADDASIDRMIEVLSALAEPPDSVRTQLEGLILGRSRR